MRHDLRKTGLRKNPRRRTPKSIRQERILRRYERDHRQYLGPMPPRQLRRASKPMRAERMTTRIKYDKRYKRNPIKPDKYGYNLSDVVKAKGWKLLSQGPYNPGGGGLAPFRIVLSETGGVQPYATHWANLQDGGFYSGHYFQSYDDALRDFVERSKEASFKRNPRNIARKKYFVGISGNRRTVFRHAAIPQQIEYGDRYQAVLGPFRTKRAAELAAKPHGPLMQHVSDFERVARMKRNPVSKWTTNNTTLNHWEERDRLHIGLDTADGRTIADWWDDDARQMFEDGFFNARNLHASVVNYANEVGLGVKRKTRRMKRNPGKSRAFLHVAHTTHRPTFRVGVKQKSGGVHYFDAVFHSLAKARKVAQASANAARAVYVVKKAKA